jgi:hypothetical protein
MPALDLHQAFDAYHDGASIIDASQCALALFVTDAGRAHVKSPFATAQVVDMLRQLASRMEAGQ